MKQSEPFVMLPRSLLQSPAWHSLGISARRLIDFLMLEHIRHAGKRNGFLVAPQRQLVTFGVHPSLVQSAIREAQKAGLVDCIRGTGRVPNRYTLTWLPRADGGEPTNRWRGYEQQMAEVIPLQRKVRVAR
jgi:hypothetical protein